MGLVALDDVFVLGELNMLLPRPDDRSATLIGRLTCVRRTPLITRRSQGLPPKEQKNLDDVVREARKTSAAKRKATKEKKDRSSAEARPAPEPAALDAHQVSKCDDSGGRQTQSEAIEGESVQASEAGANVEVSLEVDRVSDSQSKAEVSTETARVVESKRTSSSPYMDVRPGSHDVVASDPRWSEQAATTYVAREVSCWEQVRSERVYTPSVDYVWPEHHPYSLPWLSAMLEVSKFLDDRVTLNDPVQSWITELNVSRRDLALARDLTAVQVPVELCTARECVAILQTLLVEGGFQFDNLIPEWFRTAASSVMVDSLVVGAKFKVVPSLAVQEVSGRPPILEYHADDTEGDLLMTDHEFDLLGRNYILRLRMTGLRPVWSSEGSSTGEPNSKRRQYHPPRKDLLTSLPSVLPSSSSSIMESIQDARTSSSQDADKLPSQVGRTDGSSLVATTSGSYASRNSSSGSSSAVLGLLERVVGGGEMGFYVTRETIPERMIKAEVDQDDVEMARSVTTSSAQASRTRTSRTRRKHRDSGRSLSRSERTSVLLRSGRSRASAMWGTAELTVTTLHKVHDTLARLESKTSTDKLAEQEAETKRKLDEAERQIHEAERRAQEAERRFREASAQAIVTQEVPVQEIPDVAAWILAACAEAARVERERVEALALQHIQQQRAEDDERHEAERAACVMGHTHNS
ncbi:unnamed protein product [Phytophthora fragariaefolia]|uniref:Unnamed protein product n=1 Tax=Phytophthora fragariaefolia TaxID=1490495 RepID=A0A9W6YB40_9STRA|nr:unnamed protein product [Phytophthora fragariaefolia]